MSLYHYTNGNAVVGILSSKKLHLTHTSFMNDNEELVHGMNIFLDMWENSLSESVYTKWDKGISSLDSNENVAKWLEDPKKLVKDSLSKSFEAFSKQWLKDANVFTCSFSQGADLLSQWRGYGGSGTGYCIEFDEEILMQKTKNGTDLYFAVGLEECIYNERNKKEQAKKLLKQLFTSMDKSEEAGLKTMYECLLELVKFKNENFEEEKEKRLIIKIGNGLSETKFRVRNDVIVPYVEFEFPEEAIKSIMVGPSHNQEMAVEGINQFLNSVCVEHTPEILTSKIPFRLP